MKKTLIIGMALAFSATAFAAPGGKMTTAERLAKFDKTSQEYFLDSNGNLKNATGKNAERSYLEQAVRAIAPGKEAKIVENSLANKEVLKSLISIAAAKKAAEKMEDRAEAQRITDAAEGLASMIADMHLMNKAESRTLTKEQVKTANEALLKTISLGTRILTEFGSQGEGFVRMVKAYKAQGEGSLPAERLTDALVKSEGITKDKAIEKEKQIKDCV